jgi:sialate O-acetylesterase
MMLQRFIAGNFSGLAFIVFLLAATAASRADVKMPAIFGDHMVLQQDIKIPVWGWADPGEAVTVSLGDHTANATADANGKWRVDLEPVKTASSPLALTVSGKNKLTFNDVLIGDVWICSGQSNMEFDLAGNLPPYKGFGGASNAATAVPAASDPQLRLFIVQKKIALQPVPDVVGKWEVCTPDTAAFFSAVGYFFGQDLRKSLNRPIGLIGTYWGGQPAQAFTSLSGLQKDPPFTNYVNNIEGALANYPKAKADYPAAQVAYQDQLKQWNETVGKDYAPILKQWQDSAAAAKASGQPLPPKPVPASPAPHAPPAPEGGPSTPTVLYNGMIAPLIPYGIKGAIWYQGESNAGAAQEYQTLFPRMITDWREKWGEGNFPFLFVQLAAFMKPQAAPSEGGWSYLREAQLMTLALPNTGMASAIDIGDAADIHPKDKADVGLRLALAAKHVAYGQDLVYSGPIYDSMKIEGNKIRVTFKDAGSGLTSGTPPGTSNGVTVSAPTGLTGFAIAGADQKFAWAKAEIEGNTIVVSSDQVASPVAVRYGWANNPSCNLYNKEGLPASPFRTDNWPEQKPAPNPAPTPVTAPATNSAPSPKP